jgi:site-specific recombinase XerD
VKKNDILSMWVKRFLLEYLMTEKNLSINTQHSYRDTLRLFLPFIAEKANKKIDQLIIDDISSERVKLFLLHLESVRHCSVITRNQRLAAIHIFAQFIGLNNPQYIEWYRQINLVPFKKSKPSFIHYLEKSEMDALLDAPDRTTIQGRRDHAILLFLYNTGARVDEVAQMTINDLDLAHEDKRNLSSVLIRGKGNKLRRCPLWVQTIKELTALISNRDKTEHIFLNRRRQQLTRFGIHQLVKKYVRKIICQHPSLTKKRVSPHTIRHTTATHLLRAGVDINTIRAWLGHVSINTTNIYAEVDLEMKSKALTLCEVMEEKNNKHWRNDQTLMAFLKAL